MHTQAHHSSKVLSLFTLLSWFLILKVNRKMAMGRGSVNPVMLFGVVLICIGLVSLSAVEATEFTVGDGQGWTFNVVNWPNGKGFKAGDVLVFKYNPQLHNVVVVDASGYNSCKPSQNSKVFQSGNDKITLAKGKNYFICSFPGHCEGNMKIEVTAT